MNTNNLKELFEGTIKRAKNDVPLRKCDVCNMVRPQDLMINYIAGVGSPGHPLMPSFQCPHTEHWACSIEHLHDIIIHCTEEILAMIAMLHVNMHEQSEQKSHLYEEAKAHLERYTNGNGINSIPSGSTLS